MYETFSLMKQSLKEKLYKLLLYLSRREMLYKRLDHLAIEIIYEDIMDLGVLVDENGQNIRRFIISKHPGVDPHKFKYWWNSFRDILPITKWTIQNHFSKTEL